MGKEDEVLPQRGTDPRFRKAQPAELAAVPGFNRGSAAAPMMASTLPTDNSLLS